MLQEFMGSYMQIMAYHYILTDRDLLQKVKPELFSTQFLQSCFSVAKEYTLKYLTPPSRDELKEEMSKKVEMNDGLSDQIDSLYANSFENSNVSGDYIKDQVTHLAPWADMQMMCFKMAEFIKKHDNTVRENPSLSTVYKEKLRMMFDEAISVNYEQEESPGMDFWQAESHKQDKLARRTTGYSFLDDCMDGGYWDGSFIVFAGAPKVGKSQFLCNLCAESVLHGYNSLYITLELPEPMIIGRIGSNIFNIPHADYEKIANTEKMVETIQNFRKSRLIPPGEFLVKSYPTSSMTAEDLEAFVLKEELKRSTEGKRFKFQHIFVDYINIMKNPNNEYTENTYVKIKNISEHLKGVGVRNNWTIVTATQTNKSQYDSSDINAKDVAESSGLGATVDLMFGIIKDETCMINSQYYIKCIYDRVAPHMDEKKLFNFDGKYLRLKEDKNAPVISCVVERQKTVLESALAKSKNNGVAPKFGTNGNSGSVVPPPTAIKSGVPTPPKIVGNIDLVGDIGYHQQGNGNINPRMYEATNTFEPAAPNMSFYTKQDSMPSDDGDEAFMFGNKNGMVR